MSTYIDKRNSQTSKRLIVIYGNAPQPTVIDWSVTHLDKKVKMKKGQKRWLSNLTEMLNGFMVFMTGNIGWQKILLKHFPRRPKWLNHSQFPGTFLNSWNIWVVFLNSLVFQTNSRWASHFAQFPKIPRYFLSSEEIFSILNGVIVQLRILEFLPLTGAP